ncbi:hypothetical protein EYZ11_003220 [Aspergillus tanneri]|uniref:Wax synthase domain-containing protein n=1 Tax=Aspergillus tanneri TaxID=1220188 RepID=A0A4S3JNU8_9EURO|nr:uncharacterized protein ATNIH1004_006308 [Aspergillus tanneri]KAA8647614.1 hypothetical protein ATNIH1004_006308 [Aspergillus tanneri]THC97272.1 hypothetical protein EYZ11_003220 [Aspergillus tanneri]
MTNSLPPSYIRLRDRRLQIDSLIQQGHAKPVLLWHLVLFFTPLALVLLIPRRQCTPYLRSLALVLTLGLAVEAIQHRRASLGANGYILGVAVAWWCIWTATLLVTHDVERDFLRIERRLCAKNETRDDPDGDFVVVSNESWREPLQRLVSECQESLVWQPYPRSWSHRLGWVLSLLFSMRGPEWNWRISSIGPLPSSVTVQLDSARRPSRLLGECQAFPACRNGRGLLRATAWVFLRSYILIDMMKVLMIRDPYFWGVVSPPPPPPTPISYILPAIPSVFRVYRLALSGLAIFTALSFVTALNPLIFLGLSLAFPNASRSVTTTPLDAPWLYPETFGPFVTSVLDHGLAGCWGRWWHQLFRFGFLSTAQWFLSFLPTPLVYHPGLRRLVLAMTVFSMSGLIHACGSYTQLGTTRPLSRTFMFFFLQGVGVAVQSLATTALSCLFPSRCLPHWLRRTTNVTFVVVWLLFSGSYIADDFAAGGVWLVEPLPVSPLRGLGLGVEGERWWCWNEPWFQWWDGGSFWASGLRVV